ncbi:MAG: hypothetical protein IJX38_02795 [Clostridia bacterium]|nr:hypothetical protein [Clostridia bacterium]
MAEKIEFENDFVPPKRKLYFRVLKRLMKGRYKEPTYVYLGDRIRNSSIILSNHEGTDAPMSLEMYLKRPVRMWGTGEMNSGLVKLYKYQTRVYYHEKKHWNLFLARMFCLLASPLTNMFYSGFDLISTYHDIRFVKTLRESVAEIEKGTNIVIFPEVSNEGYKPQLDGFHEGFLVLADACRKKGIDLPIYVSYFRKSDGLYIVDAPVMYSELTRNGATRADIARRLCNRCNEIGRMEFDEATLARMRAGGDHAVPTVTLTPEQFGEKLISDTKKNKKAASDANGDDEATRAEKKAAKKVS